MSELPSYGTGWSETEALMDTLTIYNAWDANAEAPDFSTVRQRLAEKFTDDELVALAAVVEALGHLVESERIRRIREKQSSAEAPANEQ